MVKINHRIEKLRKEARLLSEKVKEEKRRLKELEGKAKGVAVSVEKEFKSKLATAIVTAFGLVIALYWKDIITEGINTFVTFARIPTQQAYAFRIVTAIIITFVSVIGIMLTTRFLDKGKGSRKVKEKEIEKRVKSLA